MYLQYREARAVAAVVSAPDLALLALVVASDEAVEIASDLAVEIAVACAVETGFAESAVLSTDPSPTIDFVTPDTVPVNVGDAIGALAARFVVIVPIKSGLSPIDAANSLSVSSRSGAPSIRSWMAAAASAVK